MMAAWRRTITRREFAKLAGATVASCAAGPFLHFSPRSQTRQKKLRILQWNHPVAGYDRWFEDVFAEKWGQKHDTQVIVDHTDARELTDIARNEVRAGRGHDITMFLSPPAKFEDHTIDHAEIYWEAQSRHGQVAPLAYKSTFNPRSKKYFAFCDCYMPATSNWLIAPWVHIGLPGGPNDYANLRTGARQIKKEWGIPCGLLLGDSLESNVSLHGLLWSFGGTVLNAGGRVAIRSRETIEALKFVRALFEETETREMVEGQPEQAARRILEGKVSYAVSSIGLTRGVERSDPAAVKKIAITPSLRGPYTWLACPHVTSCYVVWRFAENPDGAKKFLAALIDDYRAAITASELCNIPSFPSLAPDLQVRLKKDTNADPPYKYLALEDALFWTRNVGYPRNASASSSEIWDKFVIPRMFRYAATGEIEPEESAAWAEREIAAIAEKWTS